MSAESRVDAYGWPERDHRSRPTREDRVAAFADKAVAIIAKSEWRVNGVKVVHGFYGCETGCEYSTIYARTEDGEDHEIEGEFGCRDTETWHDEARALAKKLGVPAFIESLCGEQEPLT